MRILTVLLFLTCIRSNAQIVIDYANLSGSTCLFTSNTNVPASNGNTNIDLVHRVTVGQIDKDGINGALFFQGISSNSGTSGSEYRISYDFKQNYTYKIVVNAFSIYNGNTNPILRLKLTNTTTTTSSCNGYQAIDNTVSGNLIDYRSVSKTQSNLTFDFPSISTASSYLTIANIPTDNVVQTIEIKKITITETAPPPPNATFTLSPSNSGVACGSTAPQTFTITNVNGTPGVTSYQWNLGANNGWLYNGSAAPSTITTNPPTNSITLTPVSCTNVLSNVSATVFTGTNSYNTNTSAIAITSPVATISGPDNLCVGTSNNIYTISGIPCNASVVWSASKPGVISFTPASGNIDPVNGSQTTVTAISSAIVILRASVTTSCGTFEYSKGIFVLGPPEDFAIYSDPQCQEGRIVYPSYFSVSQTSLGATYHWSYSKNGGMITMLPYTSSSISHKFGTGTYEIYCFGSNSCGASNDAASSFNIVSCYNFSSARKISASPNPASTNISVKSDSTIEKIEILDKMGQTRLRQEFKNKPTSVSLNVSGLKNDIYTLRVYDGKEWESIQVVINR